MELSDRSHMSHFKNEWFWVIVRCYKLVEKLEYLTTLKRFLIPMMNVTSQPPDSVCDVLGLCATEAEQLKTFLKTSHRHTCTGIRILFLKFEGVILLVVV